jgi:GNAT superfamily N-acetyltransferase
VTIEFRDLSTETASDLVAFFEGAAFTDNAHWASCYCYFYNFTGKGEEWPARTGAANREAKTALVREGRAHGVLAYEDGEVVGWCHAAPHAELPLTWQQPETEELAGRRRTADVVCFVVPPDRRRQGLATALLAAAEDSMRRLGMTELRGFPLPQPAGAKDELSADARNYHGTLSMFRRAGYQERGPAGPFIEVAKAL